ncbi:MAG TPA: tRNA lysidine(34) synthetase TilS [Nitrospiraceae bacterium]|nr:tRNA lysidine(34) synthetase TilS [Nitrospiraceae bacterium]
MNRRPIMNQRHRLQTMLSPLASRVAEVARARRLFRPGDCVLAAVSGGPDSVALLSLLTELAPSWKLVLWAIHLNHGLRGAESDEDARFVASLCEQLGVELITERVDVTDSARRRSRQSLQEYAREARYKVMQRVGHALGADKIALGHTADDQAETLLMWLLRGSGTTGLAGIPPSREPLFIRPLLDYNRADIVSYLQTQKLEFREDSSNANLLYLRNRVRHELLPTLKRFNPAVLKVLARQVEILREEDHCLQQWVAQRMARMASQDTDGTVLVDRASLLALPVALQRRTVRTLIRQTSGIMKAPTFGAVAAVLDQVVQGRSGSAITVQGIQIAREYGRIQFRPCRAILNTRIRTCSLALPVPSTLRWPLTGKMIQVRVGSSAVAEQLAASIHPPSIAIFDANRFTMKLLVRSWRPGDIFQPLGMGGRRKKLQDYFTDIKLPREERCRVPLLVAPEGILWVVGHRPDHRFYATASTKRTLVAQLLDFMSPKGD